MVEEHTAAADRLTEALAPNGEATVAVQHAQQASLGLALPTSLRACKLAEYSSQG